MPSFHERCCELGAQLIKELLQFPTFVQCLFSLGLCLRKRTSYRFISFHAIILNSPVNPFRRKKVTDHWRTFISPLMWRCHWLELRMNELRSQALSYDKELAAYKRERQLHLKMIELDDSVSRSVPLPCQNQRKRAMKRRRRKRVEDTVDISSYMPNHNVFSYYGTYQIYQQTFSSRHIQLIFICFLYLPAENRSETDCQSVDNDCDPGMVAFYYDNVQLFGSASNYFMVVGYSYAFTTVTVIIIYWCISKVVMLL